MYVPRCRQPRSQLEVCVPGVWMPGGERPDAFAGLYSFARHTCRHHLSHCLWVHLRHSMWISSLMMWLLGDAPSGACAGRMSAGCLTREGSSDFIVSSLAAEWDSVTHPYNLRWWCNRRDGVWEPLQHLVLVVSAFFLPWPVPALSSSLSHLLLRSRDTPEGCHHSPSDPMAPSSPDLRPCPRSSA